MDPALIPRTAPGRQLRWLMNLRAVPSAEEIEDHLAPTASAEIHVAVVGTGTWSHDLASGLLAFGTMVRELTGAVSRSGDTTLRLELEQGARVLCGIVSIDHGGSGKIGLVGLKERPAEDEVELDRIRLLYDRVAETYEQVGAPLAHYWAAARAWLAEVARDGLTVLDVGCGPGHLVANLPPSVQVIGCDISPEMVRLAALARPTGSFVVHDYHQPFPARWPLADVTVALGCLEFSADLTWVVRNLAAATKPEGRLLLTVPRAESVALRREITLHPVPFVEITMRLWEDAAVEAALGAAGLEVMTHTEGPGFTAPNIGTVEYGYWELIMASTGGSNILGRSVGGGVGSRKRCS